MSSRLFAIFAVFTFAVLPGLAASHGTTMCPYKLFSPFAKMTSRLFPFSVVSPLPGLRGLAAPHGRELARAAGWRPKNKPPIMRAESLPCRQKDRPDSHDSR